MVVSSTLMAWTEPPSLSHRLTYARLPSRLNEMNCGGPWGILMTPATLFDAVFTTVTTPASLLAT